MKTLKKFAFFIWALALPVWIYPTEKPFVLVIPSYNNEKWYKQNLDSIFDQKYQNYRVIYISDGSTDKTAELVASYVKKTHQEHRFFLIKNTERTCPLACMAQAVNLCEKNEIVVDLDGNDWLAHDWVLSHLNKVYADEDVWVTYGQLVFYPEFRPGFASAISAEIVEQNKFRSFGGAVTHLRTFYAGLFHEIRKEDLLYEGNFIPKAGDLAYITPIMEMAGRHFKFIPEVLYTYNGSRPLNDNKSSNDLEDQMDRYIRSKEKYSPLSELPDHFSPMPIYDQIDDILHPTFEDYRFLQEYLRNGKRENFDRLKDMIRIKEIKIIGNGPSELPISNQISVNCDASDRENCVLIYSTFNRNYPRGLQRLLSHILKSDFKGHVLYRLGGWPNIEGGSLVLSHVPFAFKLAFFQEAKRLGFKRALWLDTAVVPLVSLNSIFEMIEEKGYFVMGNSHMIGPYMNPQAAAFFGLNHQNTYSIPSCSAGLSGFDFTNDKGQKILNWWFKAAQDKDAFFSPRSDQNALSIIMHQLGLTDLISLDRMPHSEVGDEIRSDSLFWLDRGYVY